MDGRLTDDDDSGIELDLILKVEADEDSVGTSLKVEPDGKFVFVVFNELLSDKEVNGEPGLLEKVAGL